jgi:hypothetical protein
MKISRIKRIQNYRIYQNWSMQNGDADFTRFNIIYGGNGSGKSTLASLLIELAGGDWSSGTTLVVKDGDGQNHRDIKNVDEALATRLCIFNADYIKQNLRFDSGETESLLYLGEESVDNQTRREELEEAINEATKSTIPRLDKQLKEKTKKRDDLGTASAAKISKKLQGVDDRYSGRRYTRKQFSSTIDKALQSPPEDMTDFDVDQQINRIASPVTEKITKVPGLNIPLSEVVTQVSEILAQTVTSQAIEVLKNNHAAADWVQTGMRLHHAGDQCLFCEGVYTEERVDRLNRHFDESLRRVQHTIGTLDAQLIGYEKQCGQFIESLEPPRLLDEARTKRWSQQASTVRHNVTVVKEHLAFLRQQIARKREELFQSLTFEESSTVSAVSGNVDVEALNVIIRDHNSDIDNYDQLKSQICSDVVQYYVEQVREDYVASKKAVQDVESELSSTKKQLETNRAELTRLKNSQQDRVYFAQRLTDDLQRYFGRDELTFDLADDDAYSIKRNGEKAEHLSEGEQRSVALLYFLRDIESNDAKLGERIVIFDDPVSSIDDGTATGAFAYIWDKCISSDNKKGVGQLFVLTHNFDFFRRWINGLDSKFKSKKRQSEYSIRELRASSSRNAEGGQTRVPYFVLWDKPKRYAQLRSEYHYLFWRAATELAQTKNPNMGVVDSYDTAILPNVCRRLLEGFLSFRYPQHIGDFREQMSSAVDQLEDSASKNYMLRLMHEYSHNEQCDLTKPIQIHETPTVVEHIFRTIQKLDKQHYDAMCEALEVQPLSGAIPVPA